VKVVKNTEKAVTFIELQMMKIVCLWRREKGQMIARVIIQRPKDGHRIPKPTCGNVRAHDDCALEIIKNMQHGY
jgi:hypothetical protein